MYDFYFDGLKEERDGGDNLEGSDHVVLDTLRALARTPDLNVVFEEIHCIGNPKEDVYKRQGLDFVSTSAMIFSLANSVSLFVMMKDMKRRGIIIATAWMVTASAVLGDHLGFTASVAQEMILPLVVTKVTGGIVAVALGLYLTRKLPETDA